MKRGGFKAGWRHFWDVFSSEPRAAFVVGFIVAVNVADLASEALIAFVRWLL
jgi:hypothetical protein